MENPDKTIDKNPKETPDKKSEGRPTSYTSELLGMAKIYLKKSKDLGYLIPTIAGLADYTGISRKTIYEWMKETSSEKKEFCDIVEKVMIKQELQLVENGLNSTYNASITKLMLTKHDYRDAQDKRLGDSEGNPLQIRLINYDEIKKTEEETPKEDNDK